MTEKKDPSNLSRRAFIRDGMLKVSGITICPLLLELTGCGEGNTNNDDETNTDEDAADTEVDTNTDTGTDTDSDSEADTDRDLDEGAVFLGLNSPGDDAENSLEAVRLVCNHLDWSWLSSGDSVFVKLSCNSGHKHPSVTSPRAVSDVCRELFERGAGRVIVGDQAGVDAVRLAKGEKKSGSTRKLMDGNGLLQAIEESGAEPYFFEEHGYEDGYFEATLPFSDSVWPAPPNLTKVIKEVDHIIGLPRMASHVLAGYTHGHKNSIGWLRDDSRHLMHFDAGTLHEKYTEVNYCKEIRDRYRLTITLAEKILLDSGPDTGTIANLDPLFVIGSAGLANHDTLSVALLAFIDKKTPPGPLVFPVYGSGANTYNLAMVTALSNAAIPWESQGASRYTALHAHKYQQGISNDRGLKYAYEKILGGVPDSIQVQLLGKKPDSELRSFLESYDQGIFDLG
ncbi:MAG: DUF362 domain-containing protein [Proteobacteria bacterium]|nr:DUF362 domain-containing protein [Pseudomonadota bacterium]